MRSQTLVIRRLLPLVVGLAAITFTVAPRAQVNVGDPSLMRQLVSVEKLEASAKQQYAAILADAASEGSLAPDRSPQYQRLNSIAARLIPFAGQWNERTGSWQWEVNLINEKQINAFCMPSGKIAFYSAILDDLKLTDDETAMVMGHEMAHALREHARSRLAKTQATSLGLALASQWLGLGQLGDAAADMSTQLIALQFSRSDETEADLVGLELAARGGFNPNSSISLWEKMGRASQGTGGLRFLSTHPSSADRIKELQVNVPRVQALYAQSRQR